MFHRPYIPPPDADEIRISSNENPMGPGPSAVSAIRENLGEANRYPMNSKITDSAIAEAHRDDVRSEAGERGPRSRIDRDPPQLDPRVLRARIGRS